MPKSAVRGYYSCDDIAKRGVYICISAEDAQSTSQYCGADCNNCRGKVCEDGVCGTDNCDGGKFLECGPNCVNCATAFYASEGECTQEKCIITTCAKDYHFVARDKACAADSPQACGFPTNNCYNPKPANAQQMDCTQGKCTIVSCEAGYKLENGACVEHDCCAGIENAEKIMCIDGDCIIRECKAGYHIFVDNNAKYSCVPNTDKNCAPPNSRTVIDCAQSSATCVDGYCVVKNCGTTTCLNSTWRYADQCNGSSCNYQCKDGYTMCSIAKPGICLRLKPDVTQSECSKCKGCTEGNTCSKSGDSYACN